MFTLPQDNSCDCGLFMLCFMQFFSFFLPARGLNSDVVDTTAFSGALGKAFARQSVCAGTLGFAPLQLLERSNSNVAVSPVRMI